MSKTNDGRSLVAQAVEDARSFRDIAVASATQELVEAMTPKIRALVEGELKRASGAKGVKTGVKNEDVDRLRRGIEDEYPGESHTGFEESADKGDRKMASEKDDMDEALSGFFPKLGEAGDIDSLEGDKMDEGGDAGCKEGHENCDGKHEPHAPEVEEGAEMTEKKDDEEKEKVDETIEISEEQLRTFYETHLQTEVAVTKGFGEMTKSGELDEVDPAGGIADVKKGEHTWEGEKPPAAEDMTVKEAIKRGMAENKALRAKLKEAAGYIQKLTKSLHEVNLFNAKVLHVNKILNSPVRLTKEQREVVLERIDAAKNINEVKLVFSTIVGSFKAAGALSESRRRAPATTGGQKTRAGGPSDKVIRESVDRAEETTPRNARFQELAGIVSRGSR